MKPFARSDRVGGQIRKLICDLMQKDIKDPRLEGAVITGVKMARDLKSARVYYTVGGNKKNRDLAAAGFKKARGYVKRVLASRLGLRYMPDLKFFYDTSFDYGAHIDDILKSLDIEDGPDHKTTESQ